MEQRGWLTVIVVAGLLYVAGQYVASQPQRVQEEVEAGREITVSGSGKAYATPNVAKYSLSIVIGPQTTAEAALAMLSQRSEAIVKAVKSEGVEEKDVATTNLSINPVYDFPSGRQVLRGFEASQSLEVIIRDLEKIGVVLSKATGEGVNAAGGLRFEVDDIEKVRTEAQEKAIEDARAKAEQLSQALGVSLGRVKTFNTSSSGPPPVPFLARSVSEAGQDVAVPEVPAGTQEIQETVVITYELR